MTFVIRYPYRPLVVLLLVGYLQHGYSAPALAADVTSCGETVAAHETGVLQTDLVCSGPFAVRLLRGATLDLNGHSITGGSSATATVVGVESDAGDDPLGRGPGRFTIVGPGEIAGTIVQVVPSFFGTDACVFVNGGRALITSAAGVVDIHG